MSEKHIDKKAKRKKALKRNLELALTPEGCGGTLNIKHKAWSPQQIPDWEFWLNMPEVELWQACALSLNVDPDSVAPTNDGMGGESFFKESSFPNEEIWEAFQKRRRLLKAKMQWQNRYDSHSIGLGDFVRLVLCLSSPWDMPQELVALAQKPEVQTNAPATEPTQEKQNKDREINQEWQTKLQSMAEDEIKEGRNSQATKKRLAYKLSKIIGVDAATIERNTRKTWKFH